MVPNFELRLMETAVAARDQGIAVTEAKEKRIETMECLVELLNQAMNEVDIHNIKIVDEFNDPVHLRFRYQRDEDALTFVTS